LPAEQRARLCVSMDVKCPGSGMADRNDLRLLKDLRRKMEHDPARPEYIQTVYGIGYKFAEDDDGI